MAHSHFDTRDTIGKLRLQTPFTRIQSPYESYDTKDSDELNSINFFELEFFFPFFIGRKKKQKIYSARFDNFSLIDYNEYDHH